MNQQFLRPRLKDSNEKALLSLLSPVTLVTLSMTITFRHRVVNAIMRQEKMPDVGRNLHRLESQRPRLEHCAFPFETLRETTGIKREGDFHRFAL